MEGDILFQRKILEAQGRRIHVDGSRKQCVLSGSALCWPVIGTHETDVYMYVHTVCMYVRMCRCTHTTNRNPQKSVGFFLRMAKYNFLHL